MKSVYEKRCITLGSYIVDNKATVRQAAQAFGISKSTVHIDVTRRLREIAPRLASHKVLVFVQQIGQRLAVARLRQQHNVFVWLIQILPEFILFVRGREISHEKPPVGR